MSKSDINILERRLRPIYDALDSQAYKKAIQECEKVLKKHPATTAAKVLKALALVRMDKIADASEILDVLDIPGARYDDLTLQAFVHCYRDSSQTEKIVILFERAVEVNPSEQNVTSLFMAYIKEKRYKDAQAIGMRLYKDFKSIPYYYWAVMALVLQANADPVLGKKMLLPLAEKMFTTQYEKSGPSEGSSAEVELYLLILEGLEKWLECVYWLDKPHSTKLPMASYNIAERGLEYLNRHPDDQFAKIDYIALRSLDEVFSSDNWSLWVHAIDSAIGQARIKLLLDEPDKKEENLEAAKSHVQRMVNLIKEHQGKVDWKVRGPYLAPFQAIKKFSQMEVKIPGYDNYEEHFGNFVEQMLDYVKHFYKKPVCFMDLQIFFDFMTVEQKSEFWKGLTAWTDELFQSFSEEPTLQDDKLWAMVFRDRCRRAFGEYEKMDAAAQRALFQQYIAQILTLQLDNQDHLMGAMCNLACAHLWEAYRKDNDYTKFYEMILLLEHVSNINRTDPVCKLNLVRAHAEILNIGRVTALWKVLDIKAVQLDTLGHLTFPVLEVAGRFNLAIVQNTQMMMMYEGGEKEIHECIAQAFRSGKFLSIPRMTAVLDRLKNSAQRAACDVMNRYLSGLFVLDDDDQIAVTLWGDEDPIGETKIDWTKKEDTRDLSTIPYTELESYPALLDDMKKRTYKELIDISELRSTLCRALGSVGRLTLPGMDPRLARVQLKITVGEFRDHLAYCCSEYPSFLIPSRLAQSPAPLHLAQWVHSGGLQMILELLEAAVKLVEILDAGEHPEIELVGDRTEMAKKLIKIIEVNPRRAEHEPLPPFYHVEPVIRTSRALQTLAGVQVVLKFIERMVIKLAQNVPKTEVTPKGKGKKEKKAAEEAQEKALSECQAVVFLEHVRSMHVELRYAGNFLHTHYSKLMAFEDSPFPENVGENLGKVGNVLEQMKQSVESRIQRSFLNSFEDMTTTIKTRF